MARVWVTLRFAAHKPILFPPGRLRPRPETANFKLGRTRVTDLPWKKSR